MQQDETTQAAPKKIAIMGSGAIGMELVAMLREQYPDTDICVWNRESGKGTSAAVTWDQKESIMRKSSSGKLVDSKGKVTFTTDLDVAMRGADVVEITGGIPRKSSSQPRAELAASNIPFIDPIAKKAGELYEENPEQKVNYIVGTNPIGLIDQRFQEISGVPHNQIVGLSGELDVSRLEQSIRLHLNLPDYDSIRGARVVGAHDNTMVGVLSGIEVKIGNDWKKLLELPQMNEEVNVPNKDGTTKQVKLIDELVGVSGATKTGGGKIADWKGTTDHEAPAAALAWITENIVHARFGKIENSKPVTCSTFVPDNNVYSGQTIKFTKDGSYELDNTTPPLNGNEQKELDASLVASAKGVAAFKAAIEKAAEEAKMKPFDEAEKKVGFMEKHDPKKREERLAEFKSNMNR